MSLNTDLTGLFNIQKDYLAGLAQSAGTDTELTGKVTSLQSNLDTLYKNFDQSNQSSSAVLARQREVSSIIDEEKSRLEQKKQSIDNALVGKKRAIDLNEAYRMRQSQYLKIKVVFVVVLAICIILTLLQRRFPIVPSIFVTLLNMIVILMGGIYCLFIYSSISSRSPMNYNELDLAGPEAPTASEIAANQVAAGKAGNLLGTVNLLGCVGASCCSAGTKWDNEKSKCVPAPATPATPATPAAPASTPPTVGGFTTMEQSGPIAHSPSEYDSYGKV
jgi:hypothetical protein